MNVILFCLVVYVMGFLTAIPIGATQVEIAKRSLNGHLFAAWMVVVGSVMSDLMYGFIAFFGIAPFLINETIVSIFCLVGAVILLILAVITMRQNSGDQMQDLNQKLLVNKKFSLFTGFSLAVTNPMMIFWWLIGERFVRDMGLVTHFTTGTKITFLLIGGAGLGSYLTTLSLMLHRAKKKFSGKTMRKLNLLLGFVLILISIYFFVSSVKGFWR